MGIEHLPQAFAALPLADQATWGIVLLAVLAAVSLLLRWERRHFQRRGKAGSWSSLRLVALFLLLPATLGAVLLPAQAVGGPEALAFFYGTLFTLAPLLWFGGHVLCGRWLRPPLSSGESLFLAASGLGIAALLAFVLALVEGPIFEASRGLWPPGIATVDQRPLAHRATPLRLFELPGAGKVFSQSLLAPAGLRLERIERQAGEGWYDMAGLSYPYLCRDGDNLHLLWSAREEAPRLRLSWRENGRRVHALWQPASGPVMAEPFAVGFRDDGLDLPVAVPRSRASLGFLNRQGELRFDLLNRLQAGETLTSDCLLPDYRRIDWQREGPVQVLALMFHLPGGRPPLRAEIHRPVPAPGQG